VKSAWLRRCAQPQSASSARPVLAAGTSHALKPRAYSHEFLDENSVVEKIAKSSRGPIRRARRGLARRSSTMLSTMIVDNRKTAKASWLYRALLRIATAIPRKS
jgi:hypothetical protein